MGATGLVVKWRDDLPEMVEAAWRASCIVCTYPLCARLGQHGRVKARGYRPISGRAFIS